MALIITTLWDETIPSTVPGKVNKMALITWNRNQIILPGKGQVPIVHQHWKNPWLHHEATCNGAIPPHREMAQPRTRPKQRV